MSTDNKNKISVSLRRHFILRSNQTQNSKRNAFQNSRSIGEIKFKKFFANLKLMDLLNRLVLMLQKVTEMVSDFFNAFVIIPEGDAI